MFKKKNTKPKTLNRSYFATRMDVYSVEKQISKHISFLALKLVISLVLLSPFHSIRINSPENTMERSV